MPGIGIISNRNARLNKLYPKIRDRMAFVVGQGGEVASTGSLDDARAAIEAFREFDIDMVAISGGDGTAHRTLELMVEMYDGEPLPPVLLLPTGTQNMVPNSLGILDSGVTTLLMAQARYRHNLPLRCVRRNLLRVNDHHSFLMGIGLAPRFLKVYYERGDTTHLGAAKALVDVSIQAARGTDMARAMVEPIPLRYRVDEGAWQQATYHTIFCSFVEEVSLRFRCFPRAGWDKSLFEVALIQGSPFQVVKGLPFLWSGSTRKLEGFDRFIARTIEFELERPEPYTLDGEVYEPTTRFKIRPGPELRFVVPGLKLRRPDPKLRHDTIGPWDMRFLV
jgi:diacylglycerol kinase family enzyme